MAYLAGNMHLDSDTILASYHQVAAIGAIILFVAESALIALLSFSHVKSGMNGHVSAGQAKS